VPPIGTASCDGGDLIHVDGDPTELRLEIVKLGGVAPVPVTMRRDSALAFLQMLQMWLGQSR
jgi:hypothetical protein